MTRDEIRAKVVLSAGGLDGQLNELARLLEQGSPVPAELAQACAAHLRNALSSGGRLPTEKGPGRPSGASEQRHRALRVAMLHAQRKMLVKDAIDLVAEESGVKSGTVLQNYKDWGRSARAIAQMTLTHPKLEADVAELVKNLQTFRDESGAYVDKETATEVAGDLPVPAIEPLNELISRAPLRRDLALLRSYIERAIG